MTDEQREHFLGLIAIAGRFLNDHGDVEPQWALLGFAAGLAGVSPDPVSSHDPTYGSYYRKGFAEGLSQRVDIT